jgi:hypothetical protein
MNFKQANSTILASWLLRGGLVFVFSQVNNY